MQFVRNLKLSCKPTPSENSILNLFRLRPALSWPIVQYWAAVVAWLYQCYTEISRNLYLIILIAVHIKLTAKYLQHWHILALLTIHSQMIEQKIT